MDTGERSDFDIQEKVLKYETFVNDVLKERLKQTEEELDRINAEIAEYVQLKCFIESVINSEINAEGIRTQLDIGCNFFIQANVTDSSKIILSLGLGYFVEFSLEEALRVIDKKVDFLRKKTEIHHKLAATTKAHIKLVLLGLQELQNLN